MIWLVFALVVVIAGFFVGRLLLKYVSPAIRSFAPVVERGEAPSSVAWELSGMYDPDRTGYAVRAEAPAALAPAPTTAPINAPAPPQTGGVAVAERTTVEVREPQSDNPFDKAYMTQTSIGEAALADYTGMRWDGPAGVPITQDGKITFASNADREEFVPVWSNTTDASVLEDGSTSSF